MSAQVASFNASGKQTVVLIFGGRSSEHSISCATAAGVMGAIDRERYNLITVGITRDGRFVPAVDDAAVWALPAGHMALPTVEFAGETIEFAFDGSREIFHTDAFGKRTSLGVADVAFAVLHGPFGEDGTIQGFFELIGLPYVGNGVLASAAGMDKEFTKALFLQAGVPAVPHVVIHRHNWLADQSSVLSQVKGLGGLPLFVKPARAGSSVGVSKVKSLDDFAAALEVAFAEDSKVVVERGVVGREVECAVLSGRAGSAPRVSVAGEIVVHGREFYDFEAKYRDEDSVELIVPATLTAAELAEMQTIASRAFDALGCRGLGRVDFFLTADGFVVNEINTMPGFTPLSMYPKLWQASGLAYADLIDELIFLATEAV
jgi:D-alanine-D-alanine ligase